MAVAHIIADASWDRKLSLAGYGGGITIFKNDGSDINKSYQGVRSEAFDVNSIELLGAIAGMRLLSKMQRKLSEPVTELTLYTDSQNLIHQYERELGIQPHPTNKKYEREVKELIAITNQFGEDFKLNIRKVKAHVPIFKASPIERLHNVIDLLAKDALKQFRNHLLSPKTHDSKHYAVAIPGAPDIDTARSLNALGYGLAKKGLAARVHFDGKLPNGTHEHPFIAGIEKASLEDGVPVSDRLNIIKKGAITDYLHGAKGLDRTLIREHERRTGPSGIRNGVFNSAVGSNAGVASRLLFGIQNPARINTSNLTGRLEDASKFVLDLTKSRISEKPVTPGEWLQNFSSFIGTPVVNDLNHALKLSGISIPEKITIKKPSYEEVQASLSRPKGLFDVVKSTLSQYKGMLEPGQMHAKVHEVLIKNGVSNSPTLSSEIYSSCLSNPNKDSDLAVLSILNAVDKAHKNDAKPKHNQQDDKPDKGRRRSRQYGRRDHSHSPRR